MRRLWERNDVRIPADPADFETTESRSALPPVEFSATFDTALNVFSIKDRQYPAQRAPTVAYRIYFLPIEFAPLNVNTTFLRNAGQKVADLVTEIQAPGRGTTLTYSDFTYAGRKGYFYCVGVSRRGLEAPPENVVKT